MHYLYKILTLGLMIISINLSAQTQSDYTLESNQFNVFESSKTLTSKLVKIGNTLKWEQQIGDTSNTINYNITDVSGNWDASNSLGQLSYTMNKSGFTSITFNLTGTESEGLKAALSIKEGNQPALVYTFNITNIIYP